LQSAAAGIKEKSIGEFSFEAPSFSLGISDISSQETNSQSQVGLSKKPRRMIFRRTLQLPPCPPSLGSKASAQVQEHCVTVKKVTEAQDDSPPSLGSKASAQVQEHCVTVKKVTEAQDDSRVIVVGSKSQEHGVQGNPIQLGFLQKIGCDIFSMLSHESYKDHSSLQGLQSLSGLLCLIYQDSIQLIV
jgi:hypothetical protein